MAPGLLEHAAITHPGAGCAAGRANDRPIAVSAEMHAISQRDLEGGDARFGQVLLAAGGANSRLSFAI
jgi:hypothetical protein